MGPDRGHSPQGLAPRGPNARGVLDLNAAVQQPLRRRLRRPAREGARPRPRRRREGAHPRRAAQGSWARCSTPGAYESSKPAEPFDPVADKSPPTSTASVLGASPRTTSSCRQGRRADELAERSTTSRSCSSRSRWLVELANNFCLNFLRDLPPVGDGARRDGSLVIDGRRLDLASTRCTTARGPQGRRLREPHLPVYAKIMEKEAGGAGPSRWWRPSPAARRAASAPASAASSTTARARCWTQIEEIVENPISVREAMYAPFRRVGLPQREVRVVGRPASEAQAKAALSDRTEEAATTAQRNAEEAAERASQPPPAPAPERRPYMRRPRRRLKHQRPRRRRRRGPRRVGRGARGLVNMLTSLWSRAGRRSSGGRRGARASAFTAWLTAGWRRDMSVLLEANGWAVNVHTRSPRASPRCSRTRRPAEGRDDDVTDALPEAEDEGGGAGCSSCC